MKKKLSKIAVLLFIAVALIITVCACTGTSSPDFSLAENQSVVWLDRYDEYTVQFETGDVSQLRFSSADEKVVTVSDGRLIATGVGETTVTIKSSKHSVSVSVRVRDSGALPVIRIDESATAYLEVEKPVPATIFYNGEAVLFDGAFEATFEDSSLASFSDGKIKGLALGETEMTVSVEYKGLSLSKTGTLTVKPHSFVELTESTATVYQAESKLNSYDISAVAIVHGDAVTDPQFSYAVIEGDGNVTLNGSIVKAARIGSAKVRVTYTADVSLYADLNVTVNPGYVEEKFNPNIIYDAVYEAYDGTVDGRSEGLMRYRPGTLTYDSNGWSDYWNHRVMVSSSGDSMTDLYRKGYRYFAYDLYYTSPNPLYLGVDQANPVGRNVGEAFDSDCYMIVRDGEITNRVERDCWITVVFDLRTYILDYPALSAGFFFTVNFYKSQTVTDCYLTDIRYYLDDSFLPDQPRTYEKNDDYIQATNAEFTPLSLASANPSYAPEQTSIGGVDGAWKFATDGVNAWENALVLVSSLGSNYEEGITKLLSRGRYVAFDLYVTGNDDDYDSRLWFAINGTGSAVGLQLNGTVDVTKCDWLIFIKDGKKRYAFEKDGWYTVVVDIGENVNSASPSSSLLFSLADAKNTFAYINNVRFYADDSFIPTEYGGDPLPKGVETRCAEATVEVAEDGTVVKYANPTGGNNHPLEAMKYRSGVFFTDVNSFIKAPNKIFFNGTNKYVKLDFKVNEYVSTILLNAAVNNGTNVAHWYRIGTVTPQNLSGYLFKSDGTAARTLQAGEWYTVYLPVQYTSDTTWADVYFQINCDNPGDITTDTTPVAYLRNIEFTAEKPSEDTISDKVYTARYSASVSLETVGETAGKIRYIDTDSDVKGNPGMRFVLAVAGGAAFTYNKKYVSFDFLLDDSVSFVTVSDWIKSENTEHGGIKTWNTGDALPAGVFAFDKQTGTSAVTLVSGKWYTLLIPLEYSGSVTSSDIYFHVAGGGCYVDDVKYLDAMPQGLAAVYSINGSVEIYSDDNDTAGLNGAIEYVNTDNGTTYGDGLMFAGVNNADLKPNTTDFFNGGYKFVKFDVYFDAGAASLTLYSSAGTVYEKTISLGQGNLDDVLIYDTAGNAVFGTLGTNIWYTVYLPIDYTAAEIAENDVCVYVLVNGNDGTDGKVYLKNLSFVTANTQSVGDFYSIASVAAQPEPEGRVRYANSVFEGDAYWQQGLYFTGTRTNGIALNGGKKYVAINFYLESGVTGISVQNMINSGKGNLGRSDSWAVGAARPANIIVYDQATQTLASTLEVGKWYTLVYYLDYDADSVSWAGIYFLIKGETEGVEVAALVDGLEYLDEYPAYLPPVYAEGGGTVERMAEEGEFNGTWKFTAGVNNSAWEHQLHFVGVESAKVPNRAAFFNGAGNGYVKFDMYLSQYVEAMRFQMGTTAVTTCVYKDNSLNGQLVLAFGEKNSYFYVNGSETEIPQTQQWITVYMYVGDTVDNWATANISLRSVTENQLPSVYIKNISFAKTLPAANE